MIDDHISRELLASDKVTPAALLNLHGYRQVLALKHRIGDVVCAKGDEDNPFRICHIDIDVTGAIIYRSVRGYGYYDEDVERYKEGTT